jgi:hypothetical protein
MAQKEKAACSQVEKTVDVGPAVMGIAPENILEEIPCPSEGCMRSVPTGINTRGLRSRSIPEEFVMSSFLVSFVVHGGRGKSLLV